jgi:aconitate hydratase
VINDNDLVACSVLSGNRNFEGRVNPDTGRTTWPRLRWWSPTPWRARCWIDVANDPLGSGSDGRPVFLRDIWPSSAEIQDFIDRSISRDLYKARYSDVFTGRRALARTCPWRAA